MTDDGRYRTIVADPPWRYDSPGEMNLKQVADGSRFERGSSSAERYGSMSTDELRSLGVEELAADDAHLYLWTTNTFMCEAHDLARAWGFEVKTIITWGKVQPNGEPSRKMGYYFRSATEHFLFCVRGSLRLNEKAAKQEAPSTLFLHRRLPHSVKPDAFFDLVTTYSPGPYLELFSRSARLGWDTWGDQALHDLAVPLGGVNDDR